VILDGLIEEKAGFDSPAFFIGEPMSTTKHYRVLRAMDGDRFYREGESRSMSAADAFHLVRLGALEELPVDTGAEPVEAKPRIRRGGRHAD